MKEQILDFFFPPKCIFCGTVMPHTGSGVCASCNKNLPYVEDGNILRKIGKYTCAVTFYYEGTVKRGIRTMKFRSKRNRAARYASYLAQTVAEHLGGEFDAVTFVPVHPLRRLKRGFDQSELLSAAAADLWGVKLFSTLRKIRNNPPQSTVKDPEERRKNVQGVYAAVNTDAICGRRFLLIDDVVTSGHTLNACADVLLAAGAESVVCATLAGGHPEDCGMA